MGFLDEAMGALGGGGNLNDLVSQAAGAFGNGGLQDMVSKFEQGGMGELVQSWVGTGANLPISAEQLQSVLGSDTVKQLAGQFGIDASQVSSMLPEMINKLTPNGQLPDNLGGKDGLAGMLGGFLKT